jgi:PKD repeat protein
LIRHTKPVVAFLAFLTALAIAAAPARAGWTHPFEVASPVSAENYAPGNSRDAAALQDGRFIYIWNQTNQDGTVDVLTRVVGADGDRGEAHRLASGSDVGGAILNPYRPTVAVGGDGSIRAAWTWEKIYCSPSCDYRYEAQTANLDAEGNLLGPVQSLDSTVPNTFSNIGPVSLSIAADGHALLAWRLSNPTSSSYRIRIAMGDPGDPVDPSETAFDTSDSFLNEPGAAAAPGGGGFVTYPLEITLGGVLINSNGNLSDPETLDPGDPNPVSIYQRSTFIDSSGTGTVVYKRGDSIQEQVFMRKMDSGGVIGNDPVMISEDDDERWSDFTNSGAAMASNGTIVVAWSQKLDGASDYGIKSRTIAPDGSLGTIRDVANASGDGATDGMVTLSPDSGGGIIYKLQPDDAGPQVEVRNLDSGLNPTGNPAVVSDPANGTDVLPVGLAYSDDGTASALWSEATSGNWDYSTLLASIFETTPPDFVSTWIQPKAVKDQGIVVAAEATDANGPVTYSWDFGDGGTADTAVASHTFTTAGTYTVKVTATDGAGNAASESEQIEVIPTSVTPPPDPIPPDTLIKTKPAKKTKAKTATFKFLSSLTGSKFECRLDKAGWSDCKSPKKLKKLKPGKHTFRVRAVNGELFDSTPASYSWTVKKTKKNAGNKKKGGRK